MRIPGIADRHLGHTRFWERGISRRTFIGTAAGATGVALGSGLWVPMLAEAKKGGAGPNPIPGGIDTPFGFLHFFFPGHGNEPSLITDFDGLIGVADLEGTGIGNDPETGEPTNLVWGADLRFMHGKYVGMDGQVHDGTFGFI